MRILNSVKQYDFHLVVFLQTSGEAQYASDIPIQGGELYAAFVVSTQVWTSEWRNHFKTFMLMEPQNNAFVFVQNYCYTNAMKPKMGCFLELHIQR